MLTPAILLFVLIVTTAFIAYWSDNLGKKLGKKRISIFGLRPRQTATVITIGSSQLIMLITLLSLLAIYAPLRHALLYYDTERARNKRLVQSNMQLTGSNQQLNQQKNALSGDIEKTSAELQQTKIGLSSAQKQTQQAIDATKTAQNAANQAKSSATAAQERATAARKSESAAQEREVDARRREKEAQAGEKKARNSFQWVSEQFRSRSEQLRNTRTSLQQVGKKRREAEKQLRQTQDKYRKAEKNYKRVSKDYQSAKDKYWKTSREYLEASREFLNKTAEFEAEQERQKSALGRLNAQAETLAIQIQQQKNDLQVAAIATTGPSLVLSEETLGEKVVAAGLSESQVAAQLDELMSEARTRLKQIGGQNGADLSLQLVSRLAGEPPENQILGLLTQFLSEATAPVSVRVIAARTHAVGETLIRAQLVTVPVRAAFSTGETIAAASIDGSLGDAQIFNQLLALLNAGQRIAEAERGVEPPLNRDTLFYASGTNERIFEALRRIKTIGGAARVLLQAAQNATTAAPLSVAFAVEKDSDKRASGATGT